MNSAWIVAALLPETRENKKRIREKEQNVNSQMQMQLQPNPNGYYISIACTFERINDLTTTKHEYWVQSS